MIFERLKKSPVSLKSKRRYFTRFFLLLKVALVGVFFPSILVTINKSVCLGGKLKINLDFLPTNQLTRFLHSIFTNYWWRLNNHSIQIEVDIMDMLRNNSNPLKGPLILSINFPVFRFAWRQAECLKDHSTLSLV